MRIINSSRHTVIAEEARVADTFFARLKGLLGRTCLLEGEALVITHCQSIHMFFMNFPIDVVFVDRQNRVVGLVRGIKPFCLSPVFLMANYAIELAEGSIEKSNINIGDLIEKTEDSVNGRCL